MHFDLQANDWNEKSKRSLRMLFHDFWTVLRISIFFPHDKKGSVTFNVTFEVFALLFPTSTVVCVNLLYSSGLFLIDSQHSCNKITIFKYPAIIDLAFSQMLVVRDQNSVSVNGIRAETFFSNFTYFSYFLCGFLS